jgi:peptidoglycan pentaglycine glycine transferase (the first glycine)
VTAGEIGDAAWDAFVEATDQGSYLQLSAWANVKAVNGWRSLRVVVGEQDHPTAGAQVLVRRPRPMPWSFAYAPRGPVAPGWQPAAIEELTSRLRERLARDGRASHLRIDPEIEADGPHDPAGALRDALRDAGWRPAPPIQPSASRLIDLTAPEDALWSDLRKKWRQYVNKARSGGVTVADGDGGDLDTFYRIYRETAERAGFLIRAQSAYRDVWDAFAPSNRARLLFARLPGGEPVASLFLVRCGSRVVEPYGGMTAAGADTRANYLLKWEAIRSSREQGARVYDLWGLAHPGIAHFKTGFGGHEVRYIGAWDLVLDPLGRQAYRIAQDARVWWARRRRGLAGPAGAAGFDGGDAG